MQKKQAWNPFLPLSEYIPDGEPHVFGDRVYLYGSHDKEGGHTFCMEDYVVYSAPVSDLADWRCEGVIYRAAQDPDSPNHPYLFAPDAVQGKDGRFYLYYCMGGEYGNGGYQGCIHVAVCDTPAGQYAYLGVVRNPDGSPMRKYICFDPAALNDNGTIRIYYGTQYGYEEEPGFFEDERAIQREVEMLGKSKEEILSYPDSIMGPVMVVLEDDMLTVREEARHIVPYRVKGTSFEGHPFFEGASMRKVGEKYYFVYSSWQNHELCYATSDFPDHGFVFGGTIVSNGEIGLHGRAPEDRTNMTGTTHGSIVEIEGQWYVFFHRLTHKSDYSRQACAEKIGIQPDGSIAQVELTSCGLNAGPLRAQGRYPAVIACVLTNGRMPHGSNSIYTDPFPNVTHLGEDRFLAEIEEGTLIGYRYFACQGVTKIGVSARMETEQTRVVYRGPVRRDERCEAERPGEKPSVAAEGQDATVTLEVCLSPQGEVVGRIVIPVSEDANWADYMADVTIPDGVHAIYLRDHGDRRIQIKELVFGD